MFGSKDSKKTSAPPAQAEDTTPIPRSHIADGMSIKGDIEGDIDLLLDGRLEGNLRCRSVTIGKSGELVGRVNAQEAVVDGSVKGDIEARTVKLNVTASIAGNIRHEVIEVVAGAKIEGHYSRMDKPTAVKPTIAASSRHGDGPPKAPKARPGDRAADKPVAEPVKPEAPAVVEIDPGAKASRR